MSAEGPAELRELLGDEGMRKFLQVYLSESKRRVDDMVAGALNGEPQRVREAVHALAPTSRWVGANGVAELCETLNLRQDWNALTGELADVVSQIAERHTAWERELAHRMPDVARSSHARAPSGPAMPMRP